MYQTNALLISNNYGNISAGLPRNYGFPKGAIIMWNSNTIPSGWAECDGQNGRPDLRGRFPIGVGDTVNNARPFLSNGAIGGAETHTLTIGEMARHRHTGVTDPAGWGRVEKCADHGLARFPQNGGTHNHTLIMNPTGGGQPHNNMPPYYVLKFIIKL